MGPPFSSLSASISGEGVAIAVATPAPVFHVPVVSESPLNWLLFCCRYRTALQTPAKGCGVPSPAINPWTVNGAVRYLLEANNRQHMAQGVLQMTQWLSEAARFRPLRDEIALVMNDNGNYFRVPQEYATQENNWGNLSWAFNGLLRQPQGTRDNNAMIGWGRIEPWTGRPQRIILDTAVAYAQYVLATSLHR